MGASARPLKTTVSVSRAKAGAPQCAPCLNAKMIKTENLKKRLKTILKQHIIEKKIKEILPWIWPPE